LSLIESLDRDRFTPTLILFTDRLDHAPPRDVTLVVLSARAPSPLLRLLSRVRQLIRIARSERLDLIVSFLVGPSVVSITAARLAGVPIVVGERSAPGRVLSLAHLGPMRY